MTTGPAAYHRQLFRRSDRTSGFARWKIESTGQPVARQLAVARDRAHTAWVAQHGPDPEAWELRHPPVVLWVPSSASPACLGCWWIGPSSPDPTTAAAASRQHAAAPALRPVTVWTAEPGQWPEGPATAPDGRLQ